MGAEAKYADHPGRSKVTGSPDEPTLAAARALSRVVLAGGMGVVGYVHLVAADSFLPMLTAWVPARIPIAWVTGAIELGLAAGLLAAPARYRRQVGWALAVFLWPRRSQRHEPSTNQTARP